MWQYDEKTEKLSNKSDDWMFGEKKWDFSINEDDNYVQIKTCNEQVTTVVGLRKKYWFGFDLMFHGLTILNWVGVLKTRLF